jgi:hypothetical protein
MEVFSTQKLLLRWVLSVIRDLGPGKKIILSRDPVVKKNRIRICNTAIKYAKLD